MDGLGYCVSRNPKQWMSWSEWQNCCERSSAVYTELGFQTWTEVKNVIANTVASFDAGKVWEVGFEFISLREACEKISHGSQYASGSTYWES